MKFLSFITVISLLVVLLLNIHQAEAQTEKGTILAGGTGFVNVFKDEFRVNLNPDGGLFLSDNLALGVSIPFYYSISSFEEINDQYSDQYTTLGISPFARYYFGEGLTRIFASGAIGYSHWWSNFYSLRFNEYQSNFRGHVAGNAGVGIAHFVSRQIGLEAIADYNRVYESNFSYGYFGLRLGFQIYLPSTR